MGTTAQKLEYLGTTKSQLKDMINYGLDDNKITSSTTFRNYVSSIFNAFLEALRTPDTLFTNLPKKSGTGANITLNDTANAPMRITLGASELTQASTPTPSSPQEVHTISGSNTIKVEGKNLLGLKVGQTDTINNVSITIMPDGYVKLNGTASANINVSYAWAVNGLKYNNEEYTYSSNYVSGSYTLDSSNYLYMNIRSGATQTDTSTQFNPSYLFIGTSTTSKTFTPSGTGYITGIQLMTKSGAIFNNFIFKLQLEKGSPATTYEPYTSQEADIDLSSKNLFDINNIVGGYRLNTTGDRYASDGSFISAYIKVESSTQYTKNSPATDYLHRIAYYTTNNVSGFISYEDNLNTITTPSTCNYIRFCGLATELTTTQFEKGSKTTKYVEYYTPIQYCKIGNYEDKFIRNSGKNLSTKSSISTTNGGYVNISTSEMTDKIVEGQKYTLSFMNNSTYTNNVDVRVYYDGNNYASQTSGNLVANSKKTYTFTATKSGRLGLSVKVDSDKTDLFTEVMLNLGSTALPYEPYGSNEWYIKKNIGKVVLDGTENWSYQNQYPRFVSSYTGDLIITGFNVFCNYYRGGLDTASNNNCIAFWTNGSSRQVLVHDERYTTKETLNEWLSSNNVICYGILYTPTFTEITGTLAEQLENVYQKLLSYTGQTNISQVNNDLSFNLNVQAIEEV